MTPAIEGGKTVRGAHTTDVFAGKEIVCAIDLCDDMYGSHGLETGFNYRMVHRFAKDNRCDIKVVAASKTENWLDSLRMGRVDIVIIHDDDIPSEEGLNLSRNIDGHTVWAVKEGSQLRQVNSWISFSVSSEDFDGIKKSYTRTFNPHKRVERGLVGKEASPYDEIFRKYATQLGWDWRMLAAVVYQESKFSINSQSHRGARGLMQVMPQTAEYYGINDLLDPENNIKAGTSHLKRLQNLYSKCGMTPQEQIKFTLAAYNAGEGRIADCRNFASARKVDNNSWDEIVKLIPLMREDSILEEESVKLGKFNGYETIAYIESVMSLYDALCTVCAI